MMLQKRASRRKLRSHVDDAEPTDRVKRWKGITISHKGGLRCLNFTN